MKRLRWWILAVLLFGGLALTIVLAPGPEPLQAAFVGRTNDAAGHQYVIVRISNHSRRDLLAAVASISTLMGKEWGVLRGPPFPAPAGAITADTLFDLPAGTSKDAFLPIPAGSTKWRMGVSGFHKLNFWESFLAWCFSKLGLTQRLEDWEQFLDCSE